jgi:hypothetical protein
MDDRMDLAIAADRLDCAERRIQRGRGTVGLRVQDRMGNAAERRIELILP